MPRIELAPGVAEDFERILAHLLELDLVLVLAIRSQREAGYVRE